MSALLEGMPEGMPEGMHALHNMVRIVMWATGLTPSSCKEKMTFILFKHRGNPVDLKY
jgi:hypothetical protein